jgi:hypothetical protein
VVASEFNALGLNRKIGCILIFELTDNANPKHVKLRQSTVAFELFTSQHIVSAILQSIN